MRIGIEAQRLFRKEKHGLEIVALEVIRALQEIDYHNDYFIYVRGSEDEDCIQETKNFRIRELPARSFPEWEQLRLPRAIKKEKLDLLHCTANTAPLFTSTPLLLTLHDIIFMEGVDFHGSHYQNFGNLYRRLIVPRVVKKAERVITVSEFEKIQIEKDLHLASEKLEVIHNGVDHSFKKMSEQEIMQASFPYLLPEKFILFFGNSAQKKNSAETIKAYVEYCKSSADPLPLVIAGAFELQMNQEIAQLGLPSHIVSSIILIGYIPFHLQPILYNRAHLFLYTSKRESFGMPILESMACGTPVITSITSSMPEIAGNAAHMVDPYNFQSIANGISTVLNDYPYYQKLVLEGNKRSKKFSWNRAAEQLLHIYETVLKK